MTSRISALTLLLVAGTAGLLPAQARSEERGRATTSDPAIRVFNPAGRVEVTGWDRDSVHLTVEFTDRRLNVFWGGSRAAMKMGVEHAADPATDSPPALVRLYVPHASRIWIKTTSASIALSKVTGEVDLASINGRMDIAGNPSLISVEGMDGAVTIRGSAAVTHVKTGGGSVAIDGDPGDLTVSTVAGNVRLHLTAPVRRAVVTSIGGELLLSGGIADGGRVELLTHAAPVELRMPPAQEADIFVSAFSGKVFSGFPNTVRTESPGQPVRYRIGAGGAEVVVRSLKGSVMISRQQGHDAP